MSENGPKLLAYVDNGMVQRNVELQWYISDFANCNGTSQSWKNCNGTDPNIPYMIGVVIKIKIEHEEGLIRWFWGTWGDRAHATVPWPSIKIAGSVAYATPKRFLCL